MREEFAKTMINNIGDGGDTSNTMDNGDIISEFKFVDRIAT